MGIQLMVFAAPVFLVLIGLEYVLTRHKRSELYHLNDSVNNISSGILEEIGTLPIRGLLLFGYYFTYEHYALLRISNESIINWIILWIGVDFTYYWFHRVCHRNNFFWIGHSVHHQSDHYNLSVALRQGFFQALTSWVFYLPLALIGFPTEMFAVVLALNTIYQFWIHTQTINRLGWFESIFNTPSHHRVHHGKNPEYIDKNYAGSLIIWDKLFGTFAPETVPVEYGVTEPLDSWNPFYANVKVIYDVMHYGKHFKNKSHLALAFMKPPEWIIKQLEQDNGKVDKRKPLPKLTQSPLFYMLFNTACVVGMYAYLSFSYDSNQPATWSVGALILLTLGGLGYVANGAKRLYLFELVRSVLLVISGGYIFNSLALGLSFGLVFFITNQVLLNFGSPGRTSTEHVAEL